MGWVPGARAAWTHVPCEKTIINFIQEFARTFVTTQTKVLCRIQKKKKVLLGKFKNDVGWVPGEGRHGRMFLVRMQKEILFKGLQVPSYYEVFEFAKYTFFQICIFACGGKGLFL